MSRLSTPTQPSLPRSLAATVAIIASTVAAPALAVTWTETGDAGQTVAGAQVTVGVGPTLSSISGSMSSLTDADLFQIRVTDPGAFSATTVGGSSMDTQVFLFTLGGAPLYMNDDDLASGGFQSTLPAGHALGPVVAGTYLIGIALSGNDPVNSANQLLFASGLTTDVRRAASGLSPAALDSFTGGTWFDENGAYTIQLTGAAPAAVPEPAAALLTALGGGVVGLAAARGRRRTARPA